MDRLRILFKTKGGHKEGMGDISSSLSIAGELKNHECDIFFLVNNNRKVLDLISQKGYKISVAESLGELGYCIAKQRFDIAILNQLNTPEDEALLLKKSSNMLIAIEDMGYSARHADLRFNILYPRADSITDFKFMPLDRVFQNKHNLVKKIKKIAENILITQGGSDTYGFTPKIIKALYGLPDKIKINIVIGPNFSHDRELDDVLNKSPRSFKIIKGKNDLSDIMLESDLAVSAGGNTLFELACLGVPAVVVCGERFEIGTAERLESKGFGICLGFGEDIREKDIYNATNQLIYNYNLRTEMSRNGKCLIDGCGIKRMTETITEFFCRKP